MSSREQYKEYTHNLKFEITVLKKEVTRLGKLHAEAVLENARLKKVCQKNTAELASLEKAVIKAKRWWQIIIWAR